VNVNIICVGKLKEAYWRDACAEYIKRLGAYATTKVVELNEARLSDKPTSGEIAKCLESEADNMMPYLEQKGAYNIAMCIEGKQLSSEELAAKVADAGVAGFSTLNLIIGSSFGLSERVKQKAHFKLSISKMTLPHQLARVVCLEQTYRAFAINHGSKYHK